MNVAHNTKKLVEDQLRTFRDRFAIPVSDTEIEKIPFIRPAEDSPEMKYLREREAALGGQSRCAAATSKRRCRCRKLDAFKALLEDSGEREFSTTMAFVARARRAGARQGRRPAHRADRLRRVAHVRHGRACSANSASTQPLGQLYRPQDADQLMWYREDKTGQILQEGITEAGAISSWIAAATAYSTHGVQMIPFFIFYSMFGFQRIGDFIWAAGDMRSRGFLHGRHLRAHDAQRRGAAARGRPEPHHGVVDPELRVVRSDLRLRGRGDHARRPAPHDRRAGRRLLLPHRDERELPSSGDAGGRRRGHPARASTSSRRAKARRARRACN